MPSKSMAIYATAAIASIITYVITAFSRGTTPSNAHEWITFSLIGLVTALLASAIIGSIVVYRGNRNNRSAISQ
ncbi:hypothetical protein [Corynebacterium spheniscorum]|uniref:Uncharacterized protein n=1 Tax=Corynebacterium spheniscorum TaxID=185761 RepID=A0A1I2TU12_9CORY|nr:hypothetical protein [Corynebacterium spheniscorum]KAA8721975.1 hypothetical protein F4V56_05270 [Corynebacterium spheniscorum]SFG68435.1 hypothetical protein SAMN05660282_01611 [Corynebacterium spheniscorum]